MAPPARFERATPSLGNWCSIQLSSGSGRARRSATIQPWRAPSDAWTVPPKLARRPSYILGEMDSDEVAEPPMSVQAMLSWVASLEPMIA